jgi:hypothetical protein
VNAVATAVKDFFFKRLPPLLPTEHMTDLETISVMQVKVFVHASIIKACHYVLYSVLLHQPSSDPFSRNRGIALTGRAADRKLHQIYFCLISLL